MSRFNDYFEAAKAKKPDFPPYTVRDGIKIVGMWDFNKFIETTKYVKDVDIAVKSATKIGSDEYTRKSLLMQRWLHDNKDAMYYGKPNESFSMTEAIQQAKDQGKTIILMDNMS